MDYGNIEQAIVDKLNTNSALSTIADIFVLPERLSDYKTPVEKGLILVGFLGEKPDGNQSVGQVSQHLSASFNVSVQSLFLRGQKGVYNLSELVKQTLIGFALPDSGPLILGEHVFSDYQNEIWEHSITFYGRSLRTQSTPSYPPDNNVINDEVYYQKLDIDENF